MQGESSLIKDAQVDLFLGPSDSRVHGEEFALKRSPLVSDFGSSFSSE